LHFLSTVFYAVGKNLTKAPDSIIIQETLLPKGGSRDGRKIKKIPEK
jgi:hypothetical protein